MKLASLFFAILGMTSVFAQNQPAGSMPAANQPMMAQPAGSQPADNMQILADKVKADRKLLVASNMQLTQDEANKFWPIYDAYISGLQKINQRTLKLIDAYAAAYNANSLTDKQAGKLVHEMFAINESELKLQKSYAMNLSKVIPEKKVARALQIENKIRAILKYQLAAQIPLVQ
ncbi:MAG: hypothetical protein WBR29_12770 [Gammaproteobacteria bacterium]